MNGTFEAYKTVAFDIIREQLADLANSAEAREMARGLVPCMEEGELRRSMRDTTQARQMLELAGTPPMPAMEHTAEFVARSVRGELLTPEEMEETFDEIQNGRYSVEERSVLQLICNDKHLQDSPYALNEIAILKRDSSSMISIRTAINGAYLNTYQADGLVIATPTGSTAYSLSVGGPIIVPHSNTIAITPVAPHSLNVRPIVIRDDWEITLDVESRSHNFLVAIDGRSETCKETTQLTIRRADYSVKVVKRFNHVFFDTLRTKMMWGADGRACAVSLRL